MMIGNDVLVTCVEDLARKITPTNTVDDIAKQSPSSTEDNMVIAQFEDAVDTLLDSWSIVGI